MPQLCASWAPLSSFSEIVNFIGHIQSASDSATTSLSQCLSERRATGELGSVDVFALLLTSTLFRNHPIHSTRRRTEVSTRLPHIRTVPNEMDFRQAGEDVLVESYGKGCSSLNQELYVVRCTRRLKTRNASCFGYCTSYEVVRADSIRRSNYHAKD